jgi:hypothetical protein
MAQSFVSGYPPGSTASAILSVLSLTDAYIKDVVATIKDQGTFHKIGRTSSETCSWSHPLISVDQSFNSSLLVGTCSDDGRYQSTRSISQARHDGPELRVSVPKPYRAQDAKRHIWALKYQPKTPT